MEKRELKREILTPDEIWRLTCIYSDEYDEYCVRMARAGKGGEIKTAEEFIKVIFNSE